MKKNLILISLDTLRADVGYSGKFKAIEKLRSNGVTFLNTISSAPLTPVSHSSIFTAQQPPNNGVRHLFKEKIDENAITIPKVLKQEGYQTCGIVSCPGMNKWYNFNMGFDHYDDEIPRLSDGSDPLETVDVKLRGSALKRADIVTERAHKWLSGIDKESSYFLFIHFFDAHWPYEAPEKFEGDNRYEEEVGFVSHYLNKFLEDIEEKGYLENTTIVCFSDHGEDLDGLYENDKGGEDLGHPEESGHGCLLYNQTQKVVLIINDESIESNTQLLDQVRLVDIAPTIYKLLDISVDSSKFDGVDLTRILNGENLNLIGYSETMYPEEQNLATNNKYPNATNKKSFIINNQYKLILNSDDNNEIYDLIKDPNELNNLYLNHKNEQQ